MTIEVRNLHEGIKHINIDNIEERNCFHQNIPRPHRSRGMEPHLVFYKHRLLFQVLKTFETFSTDGDKKSLIIANSNITIYLKFHRNLIA